LCSSCYDVYRNVFGVQALFFLALAIFSGYVAHYFAAGLSAESRELAHLRWLLAALSGLVSLILFWLTVRPFPPKWEAQAVVPNAPNAEPNRVAADGQGNKRRRYRVWFWVTWVAAVIGVIIFILAVRGVGPFGV
jgi:hypothetical protein